ncbi:MAG TPA: decaprenyl-phosphate phosphoribosyltransferase [Acidimicrobiales bacterium]|nr:decaprenyl-phosphate phosphoribosyltransferase [Acidimicrobiales bacterium]
MTVSTARTTGSLRPILTELRPRQWAKNLLVVAAPAGAEVLTELSTWWRLTLAFAAFCAASSAIYIANDLADIEADRRHPTKCERPIAAGLVSIGTARAVAAGLIVVAFLLAVATTEWDFVAVLGLYVVTTLAYSAWLKHVAILDLVIVASGFLLRAIGGAVVVDVVISSWFLIVTGFGSLFVVTGKRLAELEEMGEEAATVRPTLDHYTVPFLRFVLGVACTATAVAYCIFSFDKAETAGAGAVWFQLSAIPVVTALLRYALAVEVGEGATPEDLFLRDRVLQLMGAIWIILFGVGLIRG